MKVQKIRTPRGTRYILLDDNFMPVELVNQFLRFLDSCGRSPNTQRTYAYDLLLFCRFMQLQGLELLDLCTDPRGPLNVLADFMLWLQYPDYASGVLHIEREACKRSHKTVNLVMAEVQAFYRYLTSCGMVEGINTYRKQFFSREFKPFLYELVKQKTYSYTSIFKQPVLATPVAGITREQYNQLFSICTNRRDKMLLALLFEGGLRVGEALGIHFCDLDQIEDNTLKIVPRENNENGARVKRYASGIIYLPPYVVDLILAYISEDALEYDSDYLFVNLYGGRKGEPLAYQTVSKLFERLSRAAGFRVTPHMLRHAFAQEKLEAGWTLEQVQSYLRHKNVTSTTVYAQITDAMKLEAIKEFLVAQDCNRGGTT